MNGGPAVEQSYRVCRAIARRSGSSFYPCFALLPRAKRPAMDALYAFLRHTDDLGDDPAPLPAKQESLDRWRAAFREALQSPDVPPQGADLPTRSRDRWSRPEGSGFRVQSSESEESASRILPALADTVHRYHIPPEHLEAVIDGVAMDLQRNRYETFGELAEYCHRVASAVGLACIHIWGYQGDEAIVAARQCGLAYQLTNILRDLKEDAAAGRVYLPLEDLRACAYSVEELSQGVVNEGFFKLMNLEINRTRELYAQGAALAKHLEPDGRRIFRMMTDVYRGLLDEIARSKAQLFTRRIRLGRWQKLALGARAAALGLAALFARRR